MIRVSGLNCRFGDQVVLNNVAWHVGDTDRIGLIGGNGSGKTTLMRIIAGLISADSGNIERSVGLESGYLPQSGVLLSGKTLWEETLTVFSGLRSKQKEITDIEHLLHETTQEGEHQKLLDKYGRVRDEFERHGGYDYEVRTSSVLTGLGFLSSDFNRPVEQFSGGWQMRVALAKLLLSRPDVLLLDEPTNHLDWPSLAWLEDFLSNYEGAIVIVSHDRYFLNRTVSRLTELEHGNISEFKTPYEKYLEEKEKRYVIQAAAFKRQKDEIARIQRFIDTYRSDKRRASLVQSRVKHLEKMELIPEPASAPSGWNFRFPPAPRGSKEVLTLNNVSHGYDGKTVISDINLNLYRGDRLVVVGKNGAGKSTLLRLISGQETPLKGTVRMGGNTALKHFSQDPYAILNRAKTVWDDLYSAATGEMSAELRTYLGCFLFSGKAVDKSISILSGGELSRLALAKILLEPANLLLLDEPTNHLDEHSRSILEAALNDYQGTLILVTHDRYLIDKVATHLLLVEEGQGKMYVGNYSDYRRIAAYQELDEKQVKKADKKTDNDKKKSNSLKDNRRAAAELRKKQYKIKKPFQDKLDKIETEIMECEDNLKAAETDMANPEVYKDQDRARNLMSEQRELKERIEKLYSEHDQLEKEMEDALQVLE